MNLLQVVAFSASRLGPGGEVVMVALRTEAAAAVAWYPSVPRRQRGDAGAADRPDRHVSPR